MFNLKTLAVAAALSVLVVTLISSVAAPSSAKADIACNSRGCLETGVKIRGTGGCSNRPDGSVVCKRRSPAQLRQERSRQAPRTDSPCNEEGPDCRGLFFFLLSYLSE